MNRKIVSNGAALLFSLVFAIVAVEIVGQNFIFTGSKSFFYADVDHRMAPNAGPQINSDGIRSLRSAEEFLEEDLNIVILGDSFVYGGMRLPYEDTIPSQFEDLARKAHPDQKINVANFGWTSSSPILSLRLIRDLGAKYRPDVVLLLVDMTDFQDDIKYLRLLERYGALKLLAVVPSTVWITRKLITLVPSLDPLHQFLFGFPRDRNFFTQRPLEQTRPMFSTIRNSIEEIDRYVTEELGARFVFFVYPRNWQYNVNESPMSWEKASIAEMGPFKFEPFKYFEEMKSEVDFPIHSLLHTFQTTSVFPTCFSNDPHWNKNGMRVAAEAMMEACEKSRCFNARRKYEIPIRAPGAL